MRIMLSSSKALLLLAAATVPSIVHTESTNTNTNTNTIGDILWEETFDSQGVEQVNSNFWNHDTGRGPNFDGWGNQELQTYTSELGNVRVEDGNLELTAIRGSANDFTSGRINTKDKVLFKYGTLEARIKFPNIVEGLWPAFWTLGGDFDTVPWPAAGEIDIVELGAGSALKDGVGNSRVTSGSYWANNEDMSLEAYALHPEYPNGDVAGDNANADGFFTYKMDWTPSKIITWIVHDNPLVADFKMWEIEIDAVNCPGCQNEFHKEHFIVLNLAVGGLYTTIPGSGSGDDSSSSSFTSVECNSLSTSSSSSAAISKSSGCGGEGVVPRSEVSAPMPATMKVDYVRIRQNGFTEVTIPNNTPVPVPAQTAAPTKTTASPFAPRTSAPFSLAPVVPASTADPTKAPSLAPSFLATTVVPRPTPSPIVFTSPTPSPTAQADESCRSITDIVCTNDNTTSLCSYFAEAGGLANLLAGDNNNNDNNNGPFTVFVPNDDAFRALGPDVVASIMNNVESLTDVLLYHVVQGASSSILDLACGGDVRMANDKFTQTLCVYDDIGWSSVFQVGEGNISPNDDGNSGNDVTYPEIVVFGIEACNGSIIHILDKVMLPAPTPSTQPPSPAPSRRVASNRPTARGSSTGREATFKPTSRPSSSGKNGTGKNGSSGKNGTGKSGSGKNGKSSSTSDSSRNASLKSSKSSKNSSSSGKTTRNADLAMLTSEYAFVSSSPAATLSYSTTSSFLGSIALSLVAAGAVFFFG